jgi:hypothetical protein
LDRNAVSLIKEANVGRIQTVRRKIDFLLCLRELDRSDSYISPLLSIIEGERGREDTTEEKAECQKKESAALRFFCKIATVDSDYLDASQSIVTKFSTAKCP